MRMISNNTGLYINKDDLIRLINSQKEVFTNETPLPHNRALIARIYDALILALKTITES